MSLIDKFFSGYSSEDAAGTPFRQPSTRPGLFRLVFKENVWRLVPLNLLYLIFCIPLLAWCILYIVQIEIVASRGGEAFLQDFLGTLYTMVLGLIPCILFVGPANAGIAYATRNIARDEPSLVWQDFWHGLTKNWKQSLLIGLVSAFLPLILYWYIAFLSTNPNQTAVSMLPVTICVIVVALWLMASPTIYVMMVTYDLKFKALVKNALIMTIAHLPTAAGVGLLRLIPAVVVATIVLFFSAPVGTIILAVYGVLWGASLDWLLSSSLANRLCEEHINPQIGAPTRIGLRKEDENE